ncbi:MAG TPA: hypothetical protein VF469_41955 [Kofleriaceae bacterium]
MPRPASVLCVAPLSLVVACGQCDQPPPPRPSQPTLVRAPDPQAPTTGRRIVAVAQIAQPWHTGAWSPASITLSDVAAGDAILVLGAFWGDLEARSSTAPTDDRGALTRVVDQGPATVGRKKPPVFAQLYAELDPAPGAHTIVPPYLGGPAGDGTLYVVQLRGLTERRLVTTGQAWVKGSAIPGVSVALDGATQPGDLVLALGGYDDTDPHGPPGWSHPPAGWLPLAVQDDAANNVPSELCYRAAPAGLQTVAWTWTDPTVNIAVAVIAAFR